MITILIVDSDTAYMEMLKSALPQKEYRVITAGDGKTALRLLRETEVGLVILELQLPDMSGEQLCREIRETSEIPIIILTSKDSWIEMQQAVEWGADDYLLKVAQTEVLLAKIRFVLRRILAREKGADAVLADNRGILSIDMNRRIVEKNGQEIRLTPTEYKLLTVMAKSPNRTFTREQLITYALEDEFHGYDRSIDTYIKGLRRKIEDDRKNPKYIRTVHGFGYKYVP